MESPSMDPSVWILFAVLLFAVAALIWAIGKLNPSSSAPRPVSGAGPARAAPRLSVDPKVVQRLDKMAKRLDDMEQSLSVPKSGTTNLSPETTEKLLGLIDNMNQQVKTLQGSVAPESPGPRSETPPEGGSKPE